MHRCGSALWIESMPMFEPSKREHKNHRSRTHRTVSSPSSFPTFSSFFHSSPRYSRFLLRSLLSVYILGFATGMFWFAFLLYTYIHIYIFLSIWFWFSAWALSFWWFDCIIFFGSFSVSSRFLVRVPEYYILFVFVIRVSKSFFQLACLLCHDFFAVIICDGLNTCCFNVEISCTICIE